MMTVNTSDTREAAAIFKRVDIATLAELIQAAQSEMNLKREAKKAIALNQVLTLVEEFGMSGKEILSLIGKRASLKAPATVRFRHPTKPELFWTGRGKAPEWVKEWESIEGSRDALLVKEAA